MINNNILCYLTLTFRVSPLRGRLYSFYGAWQRCNSLEWGASERRTRDPAKRGSGSAGDALHPKNHTLRPVQLPDLGLSIHEPAIALAVIAALS